MKKIITLILICFFPLILNANELQVRQEIGMHVSTLFENQQFGELNKLADRYLASEERTSSGLWKLTLFYSGLSYVVSKNSSSIESLNKLDKKIKQWLEYDSSHPSPYFMRAKIKVTQAWNHRGAGWSKNVKKESWKPFYEYIAKARRILLESKTITSKDPHWYEMMLDVLKAEKGEKRQEFEEVLSEGLDRYPGFYEIYFSAIDYLKPKWHGSLEEIDNFALKAVERTKEFEQTGMLARIYWYSSQGEYKYWFANSPKIWKKMSVAIDDVLAKYPDSWNINNFAFFSCIASDVKKTKKLIAQIKEDLIPNAWFGQFDKCNQWGAMSKPNRAISPR